MSNTRKKHLLKKVDQTNHFVEQKIEHHLETTAKQLDKTLDEIERLLHYANFTQNEEMKEQARSLWENVVNLKNEHPLFVEPPGGETVGETVCLEEDHIFKARYGITKR